MSLKYAASAEPFQKLARNTHLNVSGYRRIFDPSFEHTCTELQEQGQDYENKGKSSRIQDEPDGTDTLKIEYQQAPIREIEPGTDESSRRVQ